MAPRITAGEDTVTEIEQTLSLASDCVLSAGGPRGPVAAPSPFWWDGAALWVPGSLAEHVVAEWRRDPRAAVLVAPDAAPGDGVAVRGRARVYGLHDPLALALHGPAIGAAASALALKQAPLLAGYLRDLPRLPASHWPTGAVLARVTADEVGVMSAPSPPDGLAPALPGVVPSRVRRALSGRRSAVVGTVEGGQPRLVPAAWSARLRLHTATPLAEDVPAVAVVEAGRVALALEGRVVEHRLVCERARWWEGLVSAEADVPATALGGIDLPD